MMDAKRLTRLVSDVLEAGKAQDTRVLDVRQLTSITDFMVVTSGRSSRQVRALTQKVLEAARAHGVRPLGTEGENNWEWVLIDFGDLIVHAMQPEIRDFYQLEKLWDVGPARADVG
jgi:ribosome-associated protein